MKELPWSQPAKTVFLSSGHRMEICGQKLPNLVEEKTHPVNVFKFLPDRAVYSMCWSPDSQSILYTSGRFLTIKPLSASEKETKWRGHDSPITTVDWNPVTNLIVTGAEDCRYKVWDTYGRCLFSSKPFEFPVTSARWCPSGEYFVVGSFNLLCLCDKTGWAHSRSQTNTGSINAIDWTSDGTHLAAAGSNGAVCFASIVER